MCQDVPGQGRAAPAVPMARGWSLHLGWWDPATYPTLCHPDWCDWAHWGQGGLG